MKIRLKKYKTVRSTNDIAIKLIRKKFLHPLLLMLKKQIRGQKNGKKMDF